MSEINDGTYLEHSGVYANGVEITNVYCQNCRKFCQFKVVKGCADLDTCACVRINNRLYLETKGYILCKQTKMYDADYDSDEDSDWDFSEDEEEEEEEEEEE